MRSCEQMRRERQSDIGALEMQQFSVPNSLLTVISDVSGNSRHELRFELPNGHLLAVVLVRLEVAVKVYFRDSAKGNT